MKSINGDLEKFRIRRGRLASDRSYGNNGAFRIRCPETLRRLEIIASDEVGWEHVSISVANKPKKIPTWIEMCFVKNLFWYPNECVIQYHPPQDQYVNFHPGTLHLWRPIDQMIPLPPIIMI